MRRISLPVVALLLVCFFCADAFADHKRPHASVHRSHSHFSFSIRGVPSYHRSFSYSFGYPHSYSGHWHGYDSFGYNYGSPYGTYYVPRSNYVEYYLPPVYFPAELAYGPQAVKQFFGLDRNFGLGPLLSPPDRNALIRPEITALKIRASNLATLQRARRYMQLGDDLFRRHKYLESLRQYKYAKDMAPDLGETYFRQGHALVATNRPELAAEAFKRGLRITPDLAKNDFLLDEIYGRDARTAKTAHLEALARQALDRPEDPDMLFLIGIFLHFEGERERAQRFFQSAAKLAPADDDHIRAFLKDS